MTKEEAKYFYDNYYSKGISTVELSKRFGHTHKYYLNAFKDNGFEIRSNKENSRKYTVDEHYFDVIDSHEKAYWLGFISSDGYITSSGKSKKVSITISNKDICQLYKFNECLKSTYPIKAYTQNSGYNVGSEYCRITITSDVMYDALVDKGVVERKSNILSKPNIPEDFYKSYILGYFDGDGSIFLNDTKYPFYSINIVGTDSVLSFIHDEFVRCGATKKSVNLEKRKENHIVSYIRYGGNCIVSKIGEYLYSEINPEIPLIRKKMLFENCKNRVFNGRVSQ